VIEILVANSAGFCFGVKRAINIATKCAESAGGEIYTYGPIIHNPQEVKKLEGARIFTKKRLEEMEGGTVIIRSHGAKIEDFNVAENRGLKIIDATCPFVKKSQEIVSRLTKEGYSVIVAGEKDHPEVQGVISYGSNDILVAASAEELKDMPTKTRIGIVAQTTLSIKRLQEVTSFCLTRASEVKVYNTICDATIIRQRESEEIARRVDCMLVVGGRNSANTNRLAKLCRAIQPNTHHIEVAEEIKQEWFKDAGRIGVTGGASTPAWLIEEVLAKINSMAGRFTSQQNVAGR
jgi:4-hydroxy-3-methylbut-2-enyl diphosphate reductase